MKPILALALAAAVSLPGTALAAMTKAELKAEKQRIDRDYDTAGKKCDSYSGNAKDVCMAEAKGRRDVANAELEERNEPSAKTREKLKLAKAEAEYEVAKEKCDERAGDSRDACVKEARAALARDKVNARQ